MTIKPVQLSVGVSTENLERERELTAKNENILNSDDISAFGDGFKNGLTEIFDDVKKGFNEWMSSEDEVCKDGNNDGKVSVAKCAEHFGKGFFGIVKTAYNHPVMTAVVAAGAVAAGAALTVATGGAAVPVMVGAAGALGAGQFGYGAYKVATATNDTEAQQGWKIMGGGVFAMFGAGASAKTACNVAAKVGVSSAQLADDATTLQAVAQTFKSIPEAVQVSATNAKGNFLTWTTGIIHANSNILRNNQYTYTSKANDVQAYRFNGSGSTDDILSNNPGVFQGDDGNFYVPNKWSPNEPYMIDFSKEQMIMMYDGTDDMAVCAGDVFKSSYVDQASFKATGAQNYLDPTDLNPSEIINATKQAKGAFAIAPEGTTIQTLEGVRTLQSGEVIAIDNAGNPYASPAANILKRNIIDDDYGAFILHKISEK